MSDLDLIAELRRGAEQVMAASASRAAAKSSPASTKRPRSHPRTIEIDPESEVDFEPIEAAAAQQAAPGRLVGPAKVSLVRTPPYQVKFEHHYVWKLDGGKLILGCAHDGCEARRTVAGETEWDLSRTTPMAKLEEMCWDTQSSHKAMCEPSAWQACPSGSGGYRYQPEEEW